MVSSNLGYIFECRHDATDRLGLVNKYNLLINEGTVNLTITCGVDSKGKIAELFRINRSLSRMYRPLLKVINPCLMYLESSF